MSQNKWMIYKAVQIIENCNENDKKLILEEEDNFCRPILFQFKMGMESTDGNDVSEIDYPTLPLLVAISRIFCVQVLKKAANQKLL